MRKIQIIYIAITIIILANIFLLYQTVNHFENQKRKEIQNDLRILSNLIDADELKELTFTSPYDNKYHDLLTLYKIRYNYVYTVYKNCDYYYYISGYYEGEFEDMTIPQIVDDGENYNFVFSVLEENKFAHTIVEDKYGHMMSSYIKLDDDLILALDIDVIRIRSKYVHILVGIIVFLVIILILSNKFKKGSGNL